jgi:hypothetical protein
MRPFTRVILITSLLSIGFGLGACADFDPEKTVESLDVFGVTKKKPLPGERKDVFPGGVPGVSQGVPAELTRGYQAPAQTGPDPAATAAAQAVQEQEAAAKPKPKPKVAAKPKPKPPAQQVQQQPQQVQQAWPTQQPQQQPAQQPQQAQGAWPQPAQQPAAAPWPGPR